MYLVDCILNGIIAAYLALSHKYWHKENILRDTMLYWFSRAFSARAIISFILWIGGNL